MNDAPTEEESRARGRLGGVARRPLSDHVYARIVVVSALSVALLASFFGWRQLRDTQRNLRERRAVRSSIIARTLDDYLQARVRAVSTVAGLIPPDLSGAGEVVEQLRRNDPDILTALAADPRGIIVAASADEEEGARSAVGRSVTDRDYFREPMRSGEPFVSGAFLGRGLGQDPIVAVAAPIRGVAGSPAGIVEASLNLRRLESFAGWLRGFDRSALVIADPDGVVVFSTMEEFVTLSNLSEHPALLAAASVPRGGGYVSRAGLTWDVARADSGRRWSVFVLQDVSVARGWILSRILVTVLFVGLVAAVSLVVSRSLARRVTRSLERLTSEVRSLRGGEAPAGITSPEAKAPLEVAALVDHVREMAERVESSRRRLEQSNAQLEATLDLARAGSRTKTAFLAKMSHELRTPLNAIIGFSALLERRVAADEKGSELARNTNEAGRAMLQLVDELLEIARVESGQVEPALSEVSLATIAGDGLRTAFETQPGLEPRVSLAVTSDRDVRVDAGHLAKAVGSVVAAAASLAAGPVRIDASHEESDNQWWVVIRISIDAAVDAETLSSLLDPFWSGESGTTPTKFGVTRLGLALAHRYAELMGGALAVRTSEGETLFTIRVPDRSEAVEGSRS